MDASNNYKKLEYKSIKAQAISWLDGRSDDFKEVCILANFDPNYVREKSRNAIKQGCKWRKETNAFDKKPKKQSKIKEHIAKQKTAKFRLQNTLYGTI